MTGNDDNYHVPPLASTTYAERGLRWTGELRVLGAAACVIAGTVVFQKAAVLFSHPLGSLGADPFYRLAILRFNIVLAFALAGGWLVQPELACTMKRWQSYLSPRAKDVFTGLALAFTCVFTLAFVMIFGRWQFGGWDYNILLETGWRQVIGQRPYVDFPATTPPLFNAGIWLAFRLFRSTWNGMLLFTGLFSAGTLLWFHVLFLRLGLSRLGSLGTAFTIEAAAMLSCCFWWYNNTTLVVAALLLVSSLALLRDETSVAVQASYVLSLTLTALAKPNIAGVAIVGCFLLLLLGAASLLRVLSLSALGLVLFFTILLSIHVQFPALLTSYLGAAKERGALSTFGFQEFLIGERRLVCLWVALLSVPLLAALRLLGNGVLSRNRREIAFWCFPLLALLITICGLRGNGELRDVETTALLVVLGVIAFSAPASLFQLRRYTVALFCAMALSNLYLGISRHRVYTIGPHKFFEWHDNTHRVPDGPLMGMWVSRTFLGVDKEIAAALQTGSAPVFFGPRLEFAYMTFRVPSPSQYPVYWQPGTAFDRVQLPALLHSWQKQRFSTVVFFKDDYTYLPMSMLDALSTAFVRDDRFPHLSVYRRRPGY